MMLQLADDNLIPLAGKAQRKAKRAIRHEEDLKRVKNKQGHKTERQDERGGNRVIRIKGKGKAKTARTVKKLKRVTSRGKDKPHGDIETPDDGVMPTPSGSMAPSGGGGGGGGGGSYDEPEEEYEEGEEEIDEDSYEQLPDEEYQDPYSTMNDWELSAGIIETGFKGIKGAGRGIIDEFRKAQTKPKDHLPMPKDKTPDQAGMSDMTKLVVSGLAGTVVGYLLGKYVKL